MEEKVFIVSTDGQVAVTNFSFEEVNEIIENAIANKEKSKNEVEVSKEELRESVGEFCLAVLLNPKVSKKILGKDSETEEIHRKSLAFAKLKGITLMDLFSDLNEMPDNELASQSKAIFGIDLQ